MTQEDLILIWLSDNRSYLVTKAVAEEIRLKMLVSSLEHGNAIKIEMWNTVDIKLERPWRGVLNCAQVLFVEDEPFKGPVPQ